ncbi:serine hydrolase [Massilia sp. ST3]|uniref:serine hydrolase domain-containing protein n=1 Tax=Massilia sp. ST3 TaxID=2824903 RepID=UPI001B837FF5|nr:serine hydrolase domain-containing protein [Massilia sp. ST3]MBQ5949996.1 beta-lactamase family protein [Massilia sp. ST3]
MKKIITRLSLLLSLLIIATPLQAVQDVSSEIATLLRKQRLEGAVWTTLDKEGAAGVSDARTGAPMQVTQRVHVGSIAKTVLALGVLRLVSEGRLSLDDPVAELLPSIRFDNPWESTEPVRLRHLLDHTAGLDDARLWHVFSMRAAADGPLAAAFPTGAGVLRVRQRPGTRFSYSNIGYTLLGMVIEAVAGEAYEPYLDRALLAPLGMHDSSFSFVTQESDKRLAMGHFEDGVTHPALPSYVRPAGQFTTTAADMGRLARFLMSDGRLAGARFIDPILLQQMGEPAGTEAARAGLRVGYGLGLRRIDRHGALAKCHGGNTVGFRAMLCLFSETRQAFFIAINADSEIADYTKFDALLTRSLMPATPWKAPVPAQHFASESWEGWYIAAPNRFDSFRFIDTVFNPVHLSSHGRSLKLVSPQSAAVTLRHAGGGLFSAPDKQTASHALIVSSEATRVISTGTQSYEQVPLWYLLSLWISVAAGMLGFAYIVFTPLLRMAMRRLSRRDPLLAPFAGALALLLPIPFFYQQSFLQMGDLTVASGLLAIVTAALPAAMLAGLFIALRRTVIVRMEVAAMLAVLQFSLVLACWGLLPLRLWA